jgi:hypothetical protein
MLPVRYEEEARKALSTCSVLAGRGEVEINKHSAHFEAAEVVANTCSVQVELEVEAKVFHLLLYVPGGQLADASTWQY